MAPTTGNTPNTVEFEASTTMDALLDNNNNNNNVQKADSLVIPIHGACPWEMLHGLILPFI